MQQRKGPAWGEFLKLFRDTGRQRHRYEVFRDFVTMAALSLHNAINKVEKLEEEYLSIIRRYDREDVERFPRLLAALVEVLEIEPWDALGQLYMELEIASEHVGQFFTPPEVSELMARLTYGEEIKNLTKPFVTVQEPACGAGGMILAFTKVMLEAKLNPAERLWVHCQDVDRTAALMCYVQLSLWNIPGVVVVGNTLTMDTREVFYTPAHYLGRWDDRLAVRRACEAMQSLLGAPQAIESAALVATSDAAPVEFNASRAEQIQPPLSPPGDQQQFDFGF